MNKPVIIIIIIIISIINSTFTQLRWVLGRIENYYYSVDAGMVWKVYVINRDTRNFLEEYACICTSMESK